MSQHNEPGARARILILDDDPLVAESLAELLAHEGYRTSTAASLAEARTLLDDAGDDGPSLAVVDLNVPDAEGLELLRTLKRSYPSLIPIAVDDFGKIETAVHAVKLGAADYLTKPVNEDELRLAVSRAENQHVLVSENQTLRTQLSERFGLENLVGSDYRMQKVYELIEAVAPTRTTALITGESGTGKSMVARAVHAISPRSAQPFVTFSCGSIPESLLESELFGHVKGAFTGADYDKAGKCVAADGGTLFIDEINSATPALQLKLLRVLQERAFEPVGSSQTHRVDVRFVLATNADLHELVREGMFREDLYYRINVVNIHMPALRERTGDIALLAEHFLDKHCAEMGKQRRLSAPAMEALRAYAWPGNVRELENVIERAVVLSPRAVIGVDDLPEQVTAQISRGISSPEQLNGHPNGNGRSDGYIQIPALARGWTPTPLSSAMEPAERQVIAAALDANDWNRQETARQLGINRTTLYKKIKQYRLDQPGD